MTTPDPVPLADVDLADIDRFLTGEQWAQFDTLRREAPVHWNPEAAPTRMRRIAWLFSTQTALSP